MVVALAHNADVIEYTPLDAVADIPLNEQSVTLSVIAALAASVPDVAI
jgi:hypothetical protein